MREGGMFALSRQCFTCTPAAIERTPGRCVSLLLGERLVAGISRVFGREKSQSQRQILIGGIDIEGHGGYVRLYVADLMGGKANHHGVGVVVGAPVNGV